jgi:hypothetical protein
MKVLLVFACFALVLSGCASPLPGILYSNVSSGVAATDNQFGNRMGEACANSWLGLVAVGDASIETARRNGGITAITSVDRQTSNVLFLYSKHCTIVRGR